MFEALNIVTVKRKSLHLPSTDVCSQQNGTNSTLLSKNDTLGAFNIFKYTDVYKRQVIVRSFFHVKMTQMLNSRIYQVVCASKNIPGCL